MAEKMVAAITSMDEDFAQWYTDIVKKAELIDYSSVKGCMILRPYGYAIWENIQGILDSKFKAVGTENVYMPMFIPESLLNKEKDHVAGFAPEVAWVTKGGSETLTERLCVRPTSETLFCPRSTTSGAPSSAGKRPPVPSSEAVNFSGRKVTPSTQPTKRLLTRRLKC